MQQHDTQKAEGGTSQTEKKTFQTRVSEGNEMRSCSRIMHTDVHRHRKTFKRLIKEEGEQTKDTRRPRLLASCRPRWHPNHAIFRSNYPGCQHWNRCKKVLMSEMIRGCVTECDVADPMWYRTSWCLLWSLWRCACNGKLISCLCCAMLGTDITNGL